MSGVVTVMSLQLIKFTPTRFSSSLLRSLSVSSLNGPHNQTGTKLSSLKRETSPITPKRSSSGAFFRFYFISRCWSPSRQGVMLHTHNFGGVKMKMEKSWLMMFSRIWLGELRRRMQTVGDIKQHGSAYERNQSKHREWECEASVEDGVSKWPPRCFFFAFTVARDAHLPRSSRLLNVFKLGAMKSFRKFNSTSNRKRNYWRREPFFPAAMTTTSSRVISYILLARGRIEGYTLAECLLLRFLIAFALVMKFSLPKRQNGGFIVQRRASSQHELLRWSNLSFRGARKSFPLNKSHDWFC